MTIHDQREDLHNARKTATFGDHRNANGTYNGVAIFAEITGLPEAEILWTFNRLKSLMSDGASKDEAKRIVTEEARQKPWEKPQ